MSLYKDFFKDRDDQVESIKSLDKQFSLRFLNKLAVERDRTVFLSTISEVRFAQLFQPICNGLKHEPDLDGMTPDLLVTINGQEIIAEVARLNPSEQDRKELDFDNSIFEALSQIKFGCLMSFKYNERAIDRQLIDISKCKEEIIDWLSDYRKINDTLTLYNSITFKLRKIDQELEHICLAGGGGSVKFDYRRLRGSNSSLLRKASKYDDIISKYNLPYIVCFHMSFETWFSERDVYNALYGLSTGNYDEYGNLSNSTLIEDALYYLPHKPLASVTGILLYHNGKFSYYHNYSDNRLNNANKEWLMSFTEALD